MSVPIINAIVLPTDIFFEQYQLHQMASDIINGDRPPIQMISSTGFFIRDAGAYDLDSVHFDDPIILDTTGLNPFNPFSMLEAGQRLYIKAGSVLMFEWGAEPTESTFATMTLVAKKKVEPDLDTAVVKLSGWFQIHDSVEGWVSNELFTGNGLRLALNLEQFAFFSDKFLFDDAFLSNFFYTVYSAVATGYGQVFYDGGVVTIKNMSDIPRVLTLVPYNSDADFISSIDENPNDLPTNVEMRNGTIILNLAANQDS